MQQRQHTTRTYSANNVNQANLAPAPHSPTVINPSGSTPPFFRNSSGKSLADLTMAEAPAQTPPPRNFDSNALTETESKAVTDLLNYLRENSYAYDSHVELINLLHKGLIAHTYPPPESGDDRPRDPKTYAFLTELRQAREAMDTRFAVGEDLFVDWLTDEMLLASSAEERIAVTELCQKAVQDEPASIKLWRIYANWVSSNYAACNNIEGADQSKWTEEDKEMCRELFSRDMIPDVLEQGIKATQWQIDESHVLWNWFAELVREDFPASPSRQDIERVHNMFLQRLQIPHAKWDETAQTFWPFISQYEESNWEAAMAETNELAAPAKQQMGLREVHELDLQRALNSGDKLAAFNEFKRYLQWEKKQDKKQKKRAPFESELTCALYERALLRFPTFVDWWLDYFDFVTSSDTSVSTLPLLERATRHCPWSGDLWARRILQQDVEKKPHDDIETTKHRATNSGLLDVGGLEELVKVLQQWCSYLRRHAFTARSSEDDFDTAEVGITMALEDVQQAGKKLYGKDFHGDPLFRLETIHIKFLSEGKRFDDARGIYEALVKHHKDSADFWFAYYKFELFLWGHQRLSDAHRVETDDNVPARATAVLQQALAQWNLDQPERILSLYLNHFQQHESGERLQSALVDAREFSKHLAIKRAKEAEVAAEQAAQIATAQAAGNEANASAGDKRKRDEEKLPNGHSEKKSKTEKGSTPTGDLGEPSASASAQIKRDRENNTITVKNLPADVQEKDIKKFFRDVGAPLSIGIIQDKSGDTATATVEFESHEDVLAAKTRNGKELNGNEVHIQSGSNSTLYVANYPPEYDEAAIRKLFESYGDIVGVRFPSLKYNSRRRFCYVSFLTSDMARAAEAALDDKMLDGNHKLLAKLSDPDAKKQRSGAQAEGRELIVKNIERSAPDKEITKFFEQYGTVVSINSVKLVNGKKTGTAFIVFSSADEAAAALAANNKPFHDRILHVEIASSKGRAAPLDRARKEDVIVKQPTSASPEPGATNGRRGSDISMTSSTPAANEENWKTARERKIAIFNLPDTVNDARIRAAMEKHGPLVKIQMRRQDQGAIVEFANVQDAFNVRQGVDCSALGAEVRTGDVADLLAKVKKRQGEQGPAAAAGTSMAPPSIARPGQRGGRRGGLGFKRGGGFGSGKSGGDEGGGSAKSNADFRSMFVKGKEDAEKGD
jgi:RNA recognition motif-containing protein